MKLITKEKGKEKLNGFIEWLIYLVGYTIVFFIIDKLFDSVYVDSNNRILWTFIVVFILSILNKTIKPVLVTLTIPITGITLGLFYPFINLFLLLIVDILLGSHFELHNPLILFFMAILLSIMNFIMEAVIKKILNKVKKNG